MAEVIDSLEVTKDKLSNLGFSTVSNNKWASITNGNPNSLRYRQKFKDNDKIYWMPGIPFHGASPSKGVKFNSQQIEFQEYLFWEEDDRSVLDQINNPPFNGIFNPHIQVWTGNKSIHNYLKINRTSDLVKWKEAQTMIISIANSDIRIKNPDRVMCHPAHINPSTNHKPLVKVFDHDPYVLDSAHNLLLFITTLKSNFPHGSNGSNTYSDQRSLIWSALDWADEKKLDRKLAILEIESLLNANDRGLSAIDDWELGKTGPKHFQKLINSNSDKNIDIEIPSVTIKSEPETKPQIEDLDHDILPSKIIKSLDVVLYTLRQHKITVTSLFLTSIISCMRYCEIDSRRGIKESNSIWIGLIGESGSKKTPVLDKIFRDPTEGVKQKIESMQFNTEVKNQLKKDAGWSSFPVAPVHQIGGSSTIEAIYKYLRSSELYPKNNDKLKSEVLGKNAQLPLPTVMFDDELSNFLGGMGRYNSNESCNIASILPLYNGKGKTDLRSNTDRTVTVNRCSFNIIGGIQPDVIKRLAKNVGVSMGLWGRFQFTPIKQQKNDKERWLSAPSGEVLLEHERNLRSICNKAFDIEIPKFFLDEEASIYVGLLSELDVSDNASPIERELRGKRTSIVMRWALAIHVVNALAFNSEVSDIISLETIKEAEYLYEKLYKYNLSFHLDRSEASDIISNRFYDFRDWILTNYSEGAITSKMELMSLFNKSQSLIKGNIYKRPNDIGPDIKRLTKEGILIEKRIDSQRKVIICEQTEEN